MYSTTHGSSTCSIAHLDIVNGLWREASSITAPFRGAPASLTLRSEGEAAVPASHPGVESASRDSEERLRLALDLSGMGTWEWDLEAGVLVSDVVVARMLGQEGRTVARRVEDFLALVHPQDREKVREAVRDTRARKVDCHAEFRVVWEDGSIHHLAARGRIRADESGRPVSVAGVCSDVTAQRQAEHEAACLQTQMQQVQKMEAMGRLAAGVAHDFNNLLTVILGHAEMSLSGLNPDLALAASLRQIADAGGRAQELTQQILAFGRGQPLEATVVDLNDELADIGKMLRRLIGEDVRVETVLAPDLGLVRADRSQMHQVIMNLAVNARDAMPGGGVMVIETSNVSLDAAAARTAGALEPGPCVALSVSDTGCGMDEETLTHIFEPFFTTKELGRGTGLGLATVYGVVRQHEGHIQVESHAGRGTKFTILLRRIDQARKPKSAVASSRGPEKGSETILLVEDDLPVRKLLHMVIASCGYDVVSADSSLEAMTLARGHHSPIRLLVTDVILPGMNGCDLYRRLRELQPDMAVLYISGYADEVMAGLGVLEKGAEFLQKPFRASDLTQRIRQLLQVQDKASPGEVEIPLP